MKKVILSSLAMASMAIMSAQVYNMQINLKDGTNQTIPADNISEVVFIEAQSGDYTNILTSEFIPDPVLLDSIRSQVANGALVLTPNQAAEYTGGLEIADKELTSLEGIEFLTGLTNLFIQSCQAPEIDLSSLTNLRELRLEFCEMTSLYLSGLEKLEIVNIDFNYNLSNFSTTQLPSTVTYLSIMQSGLRTFDLSTVPNLERFICSGNNLKSIDLTPTPKLTYIGCDSNQLTSLDVSCCPEMREVVASNNPMLSELNMTNCRYITDVALRGAAIQYFDAQPFKDTLVNLSLQNTQVSSLDVTGCVNLTKLELGNTEMKGALDLSTCISLNHLRLENTNISSVDLSNSTHIGELEAYDMTSLESLKLASYLPELWLFNIWNAVKLKEFEWGPAPAIQALDMYGEGGLDRIDISGVNHTPNYIYIENDNMREIKVWEGFDIENPPATIHKSENAKYVYEFSEE